MLVLRLGQHHDSAPSQKSAPSPLPLVIKRNLWVWLDTWYRNLVALIDQSSGTSLASESVFVSIWPPLRRRRGVCLSPEIISNKCRRRREFTSAHLPRGGRRESFNNVHVHSWRPPAFPLSPPPPGNGSPQSWRPWCGAVLCAWPRDRRRHDRLSRDSATGKPPHGAGPAHGAAPRARATYGYRMRHGAMPCMLPSAAWLSTTNKASLAMNHTAFTYLVEQTYDCFERPQIVFYYWRLCRCLL